MAVHSLLPQPQLSCFRDSSLIPTFHQFNRTRCKKQIPQQDISSTSIHCLNSRDPSLYSTDTKQKTPNLSARGYRDGMVSSAFINHLAHIRDPTRPWRAPCHETMRNAVAEHLLRRLAYNNKQDWHSTSLSSGSIASSRENKNTRDKLIK